jgi:hypothetical protein
MNLKLGTLATTLGLLSFSTVTEAVTMTRVYDNFVQPDAKITITFDLDFSNLSYSIPSDQNDTFITNDFVTNQYSLIFNVEYEGFVDGKVFFTNDEGNEVSFDILGAGDTGSGSYTSGLSSYSQIINSENELAYETFNINNPLGVTYPYISVTETYDAFTLISSVLGSQRTVNFQIASDDPNVLTFYDEFTYSSPEVSYTSVSQNVNYGCFTEETEFFTLSDRLCSSSFYSEVHNTTDYKFNQYYSNLVGQTGNNKGPYRFVPLGDDVDPIDPNPKTTPEPNLIIGLVLLGLTSSLLKRVN